MSKAQRVPLRFSLFAILVGLAGLAAKSPAATIMLPEKAMWGKGFMQPDTMDCAAPLNPGDSNPEVVCRGENESKRFYCDRPGLLMLCHFTVQQSNTSTSVRANGSSVRTTTFSDRDLFFFLDSTRMLRYINDPALGEYLKTDAMANATFLDYKHRKNWAFGTGIAMYAGMAAFMAAILTTDFDSESSNPFINAATVSTGAFALGAYGAHIYFNWDLDGKLMKAIDQFRNNHKAEAPKP